MTMTDPIADMLTRIRNALKVKHETVDVPGSKMKLRIVEILKMEGYIDNFQVISEGPKKTIKIFLKYDEKGQPVIEGLKKVSKPGRRVYAGYKKIPKVLNGYGINIISTSKGIMTDREARKKRVGGEIICSIW